MDNTPGGSRFRSSYSNLRAHTRTIATLMLVVSGSVCIALRIWSIWTIRLWGDELFDYSLSQGPWLALFRRAGLDMAHPPLFYVLLKLWINIVGHSMSGLRTLTVAIAIAAIAPFIVLGRELRLEVREIALALGLMAVNNYLIIYSYYLRQYSLLLFLALCSNVAYVKFLRSSESYKRRPMLILAVVNILFVYTHYYAWLVVIAQVLWIMFMDRRRLRRILIACAISVVLYLPWVGVLAYFSTKAPYTILDQAKWQTRPGLKSIVLLLRCFNGGFASISLNIAGSVVILLIIIKSLKYSPFGPRSAGNDDEVFFRPLALLAWLTAFPIIVSLAPSYAFSWIWSPRYVIVSIGPYLLLVAACAFRLRTPQARAAALVLLLGWSVAAGSTNDVAESLNGPNAPSYWLARNLSRAEKQTEGPIRIYGLSPYAEQGLRLALDLTRERRFQTITCRTDVALPDGYFWIALTEVDSGAADRVKELSSDPSYSLGEPIYGGVAPQRHILIPVRRS